jgi:hypothetical protein
MIVADFRLEIVRPTIERLGAWSSAAEEILVDTALHESRGLRHIRQRLRGGRPGVAVSFFQIEPVTALDVCLRYLARREDLRIRLEGAVWILATPEIDWQEVDLAVLERKLLVDLAFATAVARLRYWMVPAPLPAPGDLAGLADYWKAHWNTRAGAGTPAKFKRDVRRYSDREDLK